MILSTLAGLAVLRAETAAPTIGFDIIPSNRPPGQKPDDFSPPNPTDGFEDDATDEERADAEQRLAQAVERAKRQNGQPTMVIQAPSAPGKW